MEINENRSCDEIRKLLLDMVEGSLNDRDTAAVRVHGDRCPACEAELHALGTEWTLLPAPEAAVPSSQVRRRVLARAGGAERTPAGHWSFPRWSLRHWIGAAAVVALATATGVGVSNLTHNTTTAAVSGDGRTAPRGRTQLAPGDPIPSFAARDVFTGELLSLDELRGTVVLLNVWATWCLPCESEMPSMERVYQELGPRGLRIVALSIDRESTHMVRRWVEERGLSFTVLHDSDGSFERAFVGSGVPETYVFDRDGALVRHAVGPQRWDAPEATSRLRSLLNGER